MPLLHDGLKKDQIVRVSRNNLNPEVFRDIIISRRSIRQFKDTPVPRDVLEKYSIWRDTLPPQATTRMSVIL